MNRDPLYNDIINGLNDYIDPNLFEACTCDILSDIHPGIVPISGGSDSGMDGAICDGEGEGFPLICTTQKDVIGNLTKSIKKYLQEGGNRRKCILATSQKLTPKRRNNLRIRATKLGFVLIQDHTQEAIANLLYRHPEWCKKLLGLTGQPPALSILPATNRPMVGESLIGRESELEWLESSSGNILISGQPGSGKSFLSLCFAKKNNGLFVVSDDIDEIAASYRAQQPEILILDDAHIKIYFLEKLIHLRNAINADYRIVATCWPGQTNDVIKSMQISSSSNLELDRLTRDQIVEIIHLYGIAGPNDLIREIVNQSEGRPGLAATLCHICIIGDIKELMMGEALSRDVMSTFKKLIGDNAEIILAAFSLGGNRGMSIDSIATFLGIPPMKVMQIATNLSAGGVLTETGSNMLSVRPPTLRYVLVRYIFFKGAQSLDCERLIRESTDLIDTARTLIGARSRGANIPDSLLKELVAQNIDYLCEDYSYLGEKECSWILDNYPEKAVIIAQPGLKNIPHKIIPLLLVKSIDDNRPLNSHPEHPLRQIEDWVKSGAPGSGQAVSRREELLKSAFSWFESSENIQITLKALRLTLSPVYANTEMGPGSTITVIMSNGLITQDEMEIIQGFWPQTFKFIQENEIDDFNPLFGLAEEWLHPVLFTNKKFPKEIRDVMRNFSEGIIKDLILINKDKPAELSQLSRICENNKLGIQIDIDPEFDALFPQNDWGSNWREKDEKRLSEAKKLAAIWANKDPYKILEKWEAFENKAILAGITWPKMSLSVAFEIASLVKNHSIWVDAIIKTDINGDIIKPFLDILESSNISDYQEKITECLGIPRLQFVSIEQGLSSESITNDIYSMILSILSDEHSSLIETACMRSSISVDRLIDLLNLSNRKIRISTAIGEWFANPVGSIRKPLETPWRNAIINSLEEEHEAQEIIRNYPDIAFEWLLKTIQDSEYPRMIINEHDVFYVALEVLSTAQKKSLLDNVGDKCSYEMIQLIVKNDIIVYQHLLQIESLKRNHIAPLAGEITELWIEKALMALNAGFGEEDITYAVRGFSWSFGGPESKYWDEWKNSFDTLLTHNDSRIRKIGEFGVKWALAERDEALKRERKEEIYGY